MWGLGGPRVVVFGVFVGNGAVVVAFVDVVVVAVVVAVVADVVTMVIPHPEGQICLVTFR